MEVKKVKSKAVHYKNATIAGGYFVDHPQGEDIWVEFDKDGWDEGIEIELTFSEGIALAAVLLSALIEKYAEQSWGKDDA